MEITSSEGPVSEPPRRSKLPWLLFGGMLICLAIVASLGSILKLDALAIGAPLVGGGIGAIICGVIAGGRIGLATGSKIAIGIVFAILFFCLTLGLCFFGCMIGNYQLNLK